MPAKRKPRERAQVGLRLPEELRKRVEKAAKAKGLSMNGEIVASLERIYSLDELGSMGFGRPELFWTMHLLANAVAFVEKKTGKKWTDDLDTYREAVQAINTVLENLPRAAAGGDTVSLKVDSLGDLIGRIAVEHLLEKES